MPFVRSRTDTATLLADAGDTIIAVGDMVTYHLIEAGRTPDLALVDERTERSAVDADVAAADRRLRPDALSDNPAATLTADLLLHSETVSTATRRHSGCRRRGGPRYAPCSACRAAGASVVYGQPDEGMVLTDCDDTARNRIRSLLERMDGDADRAIALSRIVTSKSADRCPFRPRALRFCISSHSGQRKPSTARYR